MPPGAGVGFPILIPIDSQPPLTRRQLADRLAPPDRALLTSAWTASSSWIARWLHEHPDSTRGQLAGAIYKLAATADTASEMLTRAQAAINTVHDQGIHIDRHLLGSRVALSFAETRPSQWRAAVQRAAALADQAADPKLGALIALSLVYQSPETIRRVTIGSVAPDGSLATTAWAGPRAIPPELHKPLAAQRHQLSSRGAPSDGSLLPTRTARPMTAYAIFRALETLDAARSLWHIDPDDQAENPGTDGRAILHALNALELFRHR